MSVLSVDAGTTGVTALVVEDTGQVLAQCTRELASAFPDDGWVEQAPDDIWRAVLDTVRAVVTEADRPLAAVGVTNQRETVVFWDRQTLGAVRPAIGWQDRRSASICEQLQEQGFGDRVRAVTGLRLDPYFSATKLAWVAQHDATTWAGVCSGRVAVGTVDSYLIARMTRGLHHVTDASNASRTALLDLGCAQWSPEMCELFAVPASALPDVVPSYGATMRTDPSSFAGLDLPVSGIAGDQQAALFGQTAFDVGSIKCTYGTGSFVLTNTGGVHASAAAGLLRTVAWQAPDGTVTYALEGSVFVTGAAVQWLRDGLGLIGSAAQVETLAREVPDSGGVIFVPALTGLGAPHWDPAARGLLVGLSRGTTAAHVARATLDAIAYSVRDVVDRVVEAGVAVTGVAVDGGAARNTLLCQLQADQLQVAVRRPRVIETTGLGAALLAGLGVGVWSSLAELRSVWQLDQQFEPRPRDDDGYRRWGRAVELAKGWSGGG